MKKLIAALALVVLTALLAGCGGGGGAADPGPVGNVTLTVKALGAPATLYGVQFKVALPAGVILATQPSGELASGVVVPSAGASGAGMVTTYDRTATPQTLSVSLISGTGFPSGDMVTVAVSAPLAATVQADSFVFSEFAAYADFTGLPAGVSGSISIP